MSVKTYQNFINGQFVPAVSGETFESMNPYDQTLVAHFARSRAEDADKAVLAARHAFDNGPWPQSLPQERADVLLAIVEGLTKRTKDLVDAEVADSGSVLLKAQTDVASTIKQFKYLAKLLKDNGQSLFEGSLSHYSKPGYHQNSLSYEPIGVCAQIIPWNFPLVMAAWKLAPALAAGCTTVLKPAEDTPLTAMMLAEIIQDSGLPDGVVNIITGYGREVGEPLVLHPAVDKIAFTGSTDIGRHIMAQAASQMKRVTLECGGKSANIVLDDADWSYALDGVLFAIFYHAGQCCSAGSRLLLPRSKADAWIADLKRRAQDIVVANPQKASAALGPLVSKKQQERVLAYIQKGLDDGATLLTGGGVPQGSEYANGYFVEPTIFTGVTPTMTIAQEEIFGPVLSVLTYDTPEEAIDIANNSIYGLAAGVWSRDVDKATAIAKKLRAGTVWVNDYHLISEKAPFGGFKQSGIGRELGPNALHEYLEVKHIHVDEMATREKKIWYDSILKPKTLVGT